MIYLIGASTGGPGLLERIILSLDKNSEDVLVVAQHMDKISLKSLAKRFARVCERHVILVDEPTAVEKGKVYLLGETCRLEERAGPTLVPQTNQDRFYLPTIDELFRSATSLHHHKITAILLSGIGADGAEGLLALKTNGFHTIAQDEASSIVYGMPKRAKEMGAADEILSIEAIADIIGDRT